MRMTAVAVLCTVLCTPLLFAAPARRVAIQNWTVPSLKPSPNAAISGRAAFVALDPCRVVETRSANGPYGGPKLAAGTSRSFAIPGSACAGIPAGAAYSLNLTVTQPEADNGFLKAYPTGSAQPLVASLNFNTNETKGNAAIVPANGAGSIDIFSNVTTHLIIDINGYFTEPVITGVTAGTGLTGGGTSGTLTLGVNFAGSGSANTVARSDHSHYARTVIVNSGASETANGTTLLNALAGITTALANNQYLLKIEPGIYDLGTASLAMKPFVDIEGSGELATVVKNRSGSSPYTNATIIGASNAEVRFLTAECSGGSGIFSCGFASVNFSPSVANATFRASSAIFNNYGVVMLGGAPVLKNVTASASGNSALGVLLGGGTTATLYGVRASGSSTTDRSTGVYVSQNGAAIPLLFDVYATAVGGNGDAVAFWAYESHAKLIRVTGSASGASTANVGFRNESPAAAGPFTVTFDHSKLSGPTATVQHRAGNVVNTRIGASQLDGGPVSTAVGTVTCIAVYDENFQNAGGFTACP